MRRFVVLTLFIIVGELACIRVNAQAPEPAPPAALPPPVAATAPTSAVPAAPKPQDPHVQDLHKTLLDPNSSAEDRLKASQELLLADPNDQLASKGFDAATAEIRQKDADQQKQQKEKADQQQAQAESDAKLAKKDSMMKEAEGALIAGDLLGAGTKVKEALTLVPGDKSALDMQNKINGQLAAKKTQLYAVIAFLVALAGAAGFAAFLALRPKKVLLKITEGWDAGLEFPIDQKFVRVGASPEHSEIVVQDEDSRISRVHIEVHRSGRRLFIKDVSTNGTRINGRAMVKGRTTRVRKGDVISLADAASLEFH